MQAHSPGSTERTGFTDTGALPRLGGIRAAAEPAGFAGAGDETGPPLEGQFRYVIDGSDGPRWPSHIELQPSPVE